MLMIVKMGLDVLVLDSDQVLFQNPLDYINASSDVMVAKGCSGSMDRGHYGNINLGTVYFRQVVRCMYT